MSQKPFEIGLVMAGAVSAGAYTAGVIDFLLQALEEWQQAKDNNSSEAPPHDVKIKVVAGASAGGMTGAILSAMVNENFVSITSLPGKEPAAEDVQKNKLYRSWVERIDIKQLLGNRDLKDKHSKVKSLLDSTVLDGIAEEAITFSPGTSWRGYLSEPMHLYLTLTNLQGIPYDIDFLGRSGKGHSISQHTDFMHFVLGRNNPGFKQVEWLNPNDTESQGWDLLKLAALATGAFPGGLAPRLIQRKFERYDFRSWPVPQRPEKTGDIIDCFKMVNIKPSWPENEGNTFRFLSVDGGVMDNEPLELARKTLAGKTGHNPRDPEKADRAVIMIDPFPNEKNTRLQSPDELENYDIVGIFAGLFGSLMAQARFKPDELILANSDRIYSRYLVAPTRRTPDGSKAQYPIASGFLGGFGGFFSKKFRMHDFQLGRRNCQQFLRHYLTIPIDKAKKNPVFSEYTEEDFQRFAIQKNGESLIPLIPLLGPAQNQAFPLRWGTLKVTESELEEIKDLVSVRTKVVINRLIEQYIDGSVSRKLAKLAAAFKRGKITDAIMDRITEDLQEFELKA